MRCLLAVIFASLAPFAASCSSDNCLRALKRAGPGASDFCSTYTTATSTATAGLPTYATACANSPSRISSACSCVVTPTCVPSALVDTDFVSALAGADTWTSTVNQAPGQTISPIYRFFATTPILFAADFPNTQPDPFLSTVTLYQSDIVVCNGEYNISYKFDSTINAHAVDPVPQQSNCSILSGFGNIDASALNFTNVPWVTGNQVPPYVPVSYLFGASGLPANGLKTKFYITLSCHMDDWWPRLSIISPSAAFLS